MLKTTKSTRRRKVNGARPIKRQRRTHNQVATIRQTIYEIVEADRPMTVRQVFYQLTTRGLIAKTEGEYNRTVGRLLAEMRRASDIPFNWIADSTRWMRKPKTYGSLQRALRNSAATYRRALWDDQDAYVEIWLEKEALAGVLYEVTAEWDVPLMVTRGYPSLSYLYSAAEQLSGEDRPCFIYYFGDYDPSGLDISRKVEEDLRNFASDVDLTFTRVAVTPEQIELWELPSRPTKKTDTRARNFVGESVEVDAIPPTKLRNLCRGFIEQHIDQYALEQTQLAEKVERETLENILHNLHQGDAA